MYLQTVSLGKCMISATEQLMLNLEVIKEDMQFESDDPKEREEQRKRSMLKHRDNNFRDIMLFMAAEQDPDRVMRFEEMLYFRDIIRGRNRRPQDPPNN